MFGRISNAGIAIGVLLIVIGGIIIWFLLGGSELGESPVDEAAQMEELPRDGNEEDEGSMGEAVEPGPEGER